MGNSNINANTKYNNIDEPARANNPRQRKINNGGSIRKADRQTNSAGGTISNSTAQKRQTAKKGINLNKQNELLLKLVELITQY